MGDAPLGSFCPSLILRLSARKAYKNCSVLFSERPASPGGTIERLAAESVQTRLQHGLGWETPRLALFVLVFFCTQTPEKIRQI